MAPYMATVLVMVCCHWRMGGQCALRLAESLTPRSAIQPLSRKINTFQVFLSTESGIFVCWYIYNVPKTIEKEEACEGS